MTHSIDWYREAFDKGNPLAQGSALHEIERLREENERLREALTSIVQDAAQANDFLGEDTDIEAVLNTIIFRASAALNEGTGE